MAEALWGTGVPETPLLEDAPLGMNDELRVELVREVAVFGWDVAESSGGELVGPGVARPGPVLDVFVKGRVVLAPFGGIRLDDEDGGGVCDVHNETAVTFMSNILSGSRRRLT